MIDVPFIPAVTGNDLEDRMSSLVQGRRHVARRSTNSVATLHAAIATVRTIAGWPLRVLANRRLLSQMAGMSARDLADIGLTSADVRDTSALPLDSEVGQFLAGRVAERRQARIDGRR